MAAQRATLLAVKLLWISGFGVLAGLALVLLTVFTGGEEATFERAEAIRWEIHTQEVLLEAEHTRSALQDAETGQRGYVITGRQDFLEPYDAGRRDVDLSIDRLAMMTRDNETQRIRVGELRTVVASKLAELAETIALVRTGDRTGAIAIVVTERGKILMDQAQTILRAIVAEERRLLGLRHVAAEAAVQRTQLFAALLAVAGSIATIGMLAAMIVAFRSAARLQLAVARATSEQLLRMFVDHAPAPIAMFDANMRYLVTNRRYLKDFGLDDMAGADVLAGHGHYEVFPGVPESSREIHRRVLAGETCSAEDDAFIRQDGCVERVRWQMVPWRREDATIGGAVLFSEVVTQRMQAERRQALLLDLADRPRVTPRDAMGAAARLIGRHLGASRAGFGEVDEAERLTTLAEEYTDGTLMPVVGMHGLAPFGLELARELRAGHTLVVTDIAFDPRTQEASPAYLAIGIRSLIVVPLAADRRIWATLYVSHHRPRAWTADEVQLVEDVADRTWSAVEQGRTKEAHAREAEEFRTLADSIPTLCWMAGPDGHIYWYNQRWYDYTGTVAADMEGWGWQSLHDPDVLPAVLKRWHASLATGEPFEMTFPLRGADGVFRPFMTRIAPVRGPDGKIRRWLGVNTDVTEATEREAALHRSTNALRDSEARLQAIFDTAPVGIVIAEASSGRLVAGNRQADAIFGHRVLSSNGPMLSSPGSIPSSTGVEQYPDWHSVHPDGRLVEAHEYPLARALAGEARPEMEVLHQRGDGTRAWLRLIGAPLRTGELITGAVVVALDIDRETRLLEQLSEAHEAREAAQARLSRAEKLAALGQLAGGITHDFNNVMQTVGGAASLIGRHADNPEKVRRLAATVQDATRRGAAITRRLLAFARRDELQAEPIDIAMLLDGLHEVLAHTLGGGIVVRLEVTPGLLPVLADRGQLEAGLVNLATNARDAMPTGGTIELSANAETVSHDEHPAGLAPGAYIRLAVADTGIGMDAGTLAQAVEPFFTTKGQGHGTGLGLPTVRDFAEQWGGALAIASEPGRGTVVKLWLPVTAAAVVRSPETEPRTLAAGGLAPRILLVDDEALLRDGLAEELADCGYQVVQARCGDSALALLDAGERVDLILSDLSMPGMDGVSLIRAARVRRPRLPAILLTGHAGDSPALPAESAIGGSFSLLRKPVSGAQLTERVAATLLEAMAAQ